MVAYASIYGHTAEAAHLLAEKLEEKGAKVTVYDLARCDMAAAISDAFRYNTLVLAAATYNGDVFPFMHTYLHGLVSRNFRGRTVALMENGTWAPQAAKVMAKQLEGCKDLTFAATTVRVTSALNDASRTQIDALAEELTR